MIKAIVFDMDDTLVQTRKVKYKAHKHAAKKFYNRVLTNAELDRHWGKPFNDVMLGLYGTTDPLEKVLANYYSISQNFPIPAHPNASYVIAKISDHYLTGLVTAANSRLMVDALSQAGIDRTLFTYIQTSDDSSFHKPDPKVFDPTLKFFAGRGIQPSEIIYIGDVLNDFYAARDAGIHFVGISGHSIPKATFAKAGAETVDSLLELIDRFSW